MDDNTVGTLLEIGSLKRLKEILSSFKTLSSLSTNYEKTALMRIGNLDGEISENINYLGFSITPTIKLLGYHISNNDDILDINFAPIKGKIQSIIRFWERFYLSLPGKITVYKTLLLPQLNYIGSILMPIENWIQDISGIMEQFVTQVFQ